MPQKIETIPADVVEARKRRVKFRLAGARQKPILIAMPFAMESDRIIEFCRADIRQKPRPEDTGDERLAGCADSRLLSRGRLVPGSPTAIDPTPLVNIRSPALYRMTLFHRLRRSQCRRTIIVVYSESLC